MTGDEPATDRHPSVVVRLGTALKRRETLVRLGRLGALAALLALAAGVVYLLVWVYRLARGVFLPGNLMLELHMVETVLLGALGLDLLVRLLRLRRGVSVRLELPDERRLAVTRPLVVGRAPGAWGVALEDRVVSAEHLRVSRTEDGLEVEDLGSRNGTFVGSEDIRGRGRRLLRTGDSVRLGEGGPTLSVVSGRLRGVLPVWGFPAGVVALAAIGLFLGWRANVSSLPGMAVQLPSAAASFAVFRSGGLVAALLLAVAVLFGLWELGLARHGDRLLELTHRAVGLLLVVGLVTLYPLMPREGLRYARLAERRAQVATQNRHPARDRATAATSQDSAATDAPGHRLARLAATLAVPAGAGFLSTTFFKQAFGALLGAGLFLVFPLWWPAARRFALRSVARLSEPMFPGARWRPARVLWWDVVLGSLAGAVILLTLLTPLGTDLGRGQRLWLRTPFGTIQSIELAKALFLFFMAGYFGRRGRLLELVPRSRYLAPFLGASLFALLTTAVQADMGGLLMLGLLVTAVFVLATGAMRLVAAVPALLAVGVGLALALGKAGTMLERLHLWLDPVHHLKGGQVVEARQLLMSSGWTGFAPNRILSWRIPDIHGDLSFAAMAERFGLVGGLGFLAAWATLVVALLLWARRRQRAGEAAVPVLLGGVAGLLLLQLATQAGGVLGLMPFTGVPIPWLSQGLTATLVFTALLGLATAAAPTLSEPVAEVAPLPKKRILYAERAALACVLGIAMGSAWWLAWLPAGGRYGEHGATYRWVNPRMMARVERLVDAGVFKAAGGRVVRLDQNAWQRFLEAHPEDRELNLARLLSGLHEADGKIVPRPWLVSGTNPYARRPLPRGWIVGRDGTVLAMNLRDGRRSYPLGRGAFHVVGVPGGLTQGYGLETRLAGVLEGAELPRLAKLRAFAEDIHHGAGVELTLLPALQREAFDQLRGRPGAAVVMDVRDGSLLAMASSPAPNPDSRKIAPDEIPNRAVSYAHPYCPPGSTFKMVMDVAALSAPDFDPSHKIRCKGYDPRLDVRCAHGIAHGKVNLATATTVSCNIYFSNLAVTLGPEAILQAAGRLGFNPSQPVDLLYGAGGEPWLVTPSTVEPQRNGDPRWLARVGFGQGPVNATPLQMARVGAAIANGGLLPAPHLVRTVQLAAYEGAQRERRVVWERRIRPERPTRAIPRLMARQLNRLLRTVFEDPRGTAHNLPRLWRGPGGWVLSRSRPGPKWKPVPVAGKTGSAWRAARSSKDDAWMVAWAPADHPRVVACVLVESAGTGGRVAGPIALALLRDALAALDRDVAP